MTHSDIVQSWVDAHDELTLDGSAIKHDGERLGTVSRSGNVNIADDGGVYGEPIEVDDGWLIVEGRRTMWVRPGDEDLYEEAEVIDEGLIERNGRFAVQPMYPRNPEIDGPLPEQ